MMRAKPFLAIFLMFMGCSSLPYKDELTKYFELNAKIVPIIEDVKIDSVAKLGSYKEYWNDGIRKRRESRKKFYQESIDMQMEFLRDWKREFRNSSAYKDTVRFYVEIKKYQNRLDSLEYETDPVYETYKELINTNSEYEYLTVKYKLSKDGSTLIQNFVVENKSTIYPSNMSLDKFVKDIVFDNLRVKKVEEYKRLNPI